MNRVLNSIDSFGPISRNDLRPCVKELAISFCKFLSPFSLPKFSHSSETKDLIERRIVKILLAPL